MRRCGCPLPPRQNPPRSRGRKRRWESSCSRGQQSPRPAPSMQSGPAERLYRSPPRKPCCRECSGSSCPFSTHRRDVKQLILRVRRCHLHSGSAGDRLAAAGGDAGVGRHVGIGRNDKHIAEQHPEFFSRDHRHRGLLPASKLRRAGEHIDRAIGIDAQHPRQRHSRQACRHAGKREWPCRNPS